ncbi:putative 3-oxoacyl-[acyl-carrier-protein] reductase [Helianthus annuus]|nr:putative 3-oxoacyl-[acyl-carrier-protein] reductase [Helianthus annuus]
MAVSTQHVTTSTLEPWRDLTGTIVMVTGASSGIGWEFCIDLAKSGCRIIAAARRVDRLKALCDEINRLRVSDTHSNRTQTINDDVLAVAVELDVSADAPTIQASVIKAWDAFGRIDALINNAGIRGPVQNPLKLSEEDWDKTFGTNIKGSWLVSKYVGLKMLEFNQGGSIINISSTAGLNRGHLPGALAYASSKSALNTMTKVMAMELGRHKIRVNSISPGIFKSEITEELLQKKWFKNVVSKTMPLKELGITDPGLTSLVKYLIHGSSDYVTGNIFIVDSGYTLPGVPIYSSL